MGEHFSSWSERITSPLISLATLISRTQHIKFGTGVINMPQMHPATVAAHVAMFDQLCRGRFIFGIRPGGLVSDFELFDVGDAELRPPMMLESIDTVPKLWAQDPPYRIDGRASGSSRIRPSRSRCSRPTRRARGRRASGTGFPSPGTSSTAAICADTGSATWRAARRWGAGPIPTPVCPSTTASSCSASVACARRYSW